MARLSKQQVLEAPLKTEEVDVPEWGGSVLVGEWPVAKTKSVMAMFKAQEGGTPDDLSPDMLAKIFVMGCVDPVFTEKDVPAMLKKSGMVVFRIVQRIMDMNGMTAEARDEARGNS